MTTFIETRFPIARLSAESYKERKANNGQTLTRLGKWWGRKPLILVRREPVAVGVDSPPPESRLDVLRPVERRAVRRTPREGRFDPLIAGSHSLARCTAIPVVSHRQSVCSCTRRRVPHA